MADVTINIQSNMSGATSQIRAFSAALKEATAQVSKTGTAAKQTGQQVKATSRSIGDLGKQASKSSGGVAKFVSSLGRIAFYRLVRTAIRAVTSAFREGLQNAYQFSKMNGGPLAQSMDKLRKSAGIMKNQLGAAFGGLLTAITPILVRIINLVTAAADAITQFFALLNGKTAYKRAINGLDDIADAAGNAGKKIKGLLAPWDELNVIGSESGGGGGGSSNVDYGDLFEYSGIADWVVELFESTGLKQAIEHIKETWNEFLEALNLDNFDKSNLEVFFSFLAGLCNTVADAMQIVVDLINGDFTQAWTHFKELIFGGGSNETPFSEINAFWESGYEKGEEARQKIEEILNYISNLWREFCTNFLLTWYDVRDFFVDLWKWIDTHIVRPLKNIFSGATFESNSLSFSFDVVGNFQLFVQLWNSIKSKTATLTTKKAGTKESVFTNIGNAWQKIVTKVADLTANLGGTADLPSKIKTIKDAWVGIKTSTKKLTAKLAGTAVKTFGTLRDRWSAISTKTSTLTAELKNNVNESSLAQIKEAFTSLKSKYETKLTASMTIASGMKDFVLGWNKIVSEKTVTLKAEIAENVKSAWNSAVKKWNASWLASQFGTIPTLASGGIAYDDTLAMVGEYSGASSNPEVIAPLSDLVKILGDTNNAKENSKRMAEQNTLLQEQNKLLTKILQKELVISPSASLGQVVARSNALYGRA